MAKSTRSKKKAAPKKKSLLPPGDYRRGLFLDCAGTTGWASRDFQSGKTRSSIVKFPRDVRKNGAFLHSFYGWVGRKIAEIKPDVVFVEQPHLRGFSTFHLVSMAGIVEIQAHLARVPCVSLHSSRVRSSLYGPSAKIYQNRAVQALAAELASESEIKRNWRKRAIIMLMRDYGYKPRDDNEADALGMAEYVSPMILTGEL